MLNICWQPWCGLKSTSSVKLSQASQTELMFSSEGLYFSHRFLWSSDVHRTQRGSVVIQAPLSLARGLPRWPSEEESTCWCRPHETLRFDPWAGKTPWRREGQPTPVFRPGESMDREPGGVQGGGRDWMTKAFTLLCTLCALSTWGFEKFQWAQELWDKPREC